MCAATLKRECGCSTRSALRRLTSVCSKRLRRSVNRCTLRALLLTPRPPPRTLLAPSSWTSAVPKKFKRWPNVLRVAAWLRPPPMAAQRAIAQTRCVWPLSAPSRWCWNSSRSRSACSRQNRTTATGMLNSAGSVTPSSGASLRSSNRRRSEALRLESVPCRSALRGLCCRSRRSLASGKVVSSCSDFCSAWCCRHAPVPPTLRVTRLRRWPPRLAATKLPRRWMAILTPRAVWRVARAFGPCRCSSRVSPSAC
mmetsp:Transcript_60574/g.169195  ORF Transcript_60574/g.169195 Transcript_60574/m.169195 type:complete len:254 (-) Transcript_60574:360-1121(-)